MKNKTLEECNLTPERIVALANLVSQAIESIDSQVEDATERANKAIKSHASHKGLIKALALLADAEDIIPKELLDEDFEGTVNTRLADEVKKAKALHNYDMLVELHPILHELKFELSNE